MGGRGSLPEEKGCLPEGRGSLPEGRERADTCCTKGLRGRWFTGPVKYLLIISILKTGIFHLFLCHYLEYVCVSEVAGW